MKRNRWFVAVALALAVAIASTPTGRAWLSVFDTWWNDLLYWLEGLF